MRGADKRPGSLLSYLEVRVPTDHPLRAIRQIVNGAASDLSPDFAAMYASLGRPSIPPDEFRGAHCCKAFYTICSERQLMERLKFDLLYRWFVELGIDCAVWDHSPFSKNGDGGSELVEALARMKSLRPRRGTGRTCGKRRTE